MEPMTDKDHKDRIELDLAVLQRDIAVARNAGIIVEISVQRIVSMSLGNIEEITAKLSRQI